MMTLTDVYCRINRARGMEVSTSAVLVERKELNGKLLGNSLILRVATSDMKQIMAVFYCISLITESYMIFSVIYVVTTEWNMHDR